MIAIVGRDGHRLQKRTKQIYNKSIEVYVDKKGRMFEWNGLVGLN